MAARKLPSYAQLFIVQRLVALDTPAEIAALVRSKWGLSLSSQAIERYDPRLNPHLCERWREKFEQEEQKFRACHERRCDPAQSRVWRQGQRRLLVDRGAKVPQLIRHLLNDAAKDASFS